VCDGFETPTPVAVEGLTGVRDLVATRGYTCALTTSGTVSCWGDGIIPPHDQAPLTFLVTRPTPIRDVTNAVGIAATDRMFCVLDGSSSVTCWVDFQLGSSTVTLGGQPTKIVAGGINFCALLENGAVQCWGNGENLFTPVTVPGLTL
jgi:hypothetical protein